VLPAGYRLLAWNPELLEDHTEVKYQSFRGEIDANVFPCFNERASCQRLMQEISRKEGFLPQATWLAEFCGAGSNRQEFCGTIQGLQDKNGYGAIQNVGITPFHRGRGLGTALLHQAFAGFQAAGLRRVYLEVTARNQSAILLYRRLGFRKVRTLYKAVEVAYS
jgi:ribosomal protein S18 acetylase RimI-like enzyme